MDFDQLHTFLEIVRLKSFSKAAQTCYRTQPAISAQIRQLEQPDRGRNSDVRRAEIGRVLRLRGYVVTIGAPGSTASRLALVGIDRFAR